eukprot:364192-Chlamydomonas_euryale.AAC.12
MKAPRANQIWSQSRGCHLATGQLGEGHEHEALCMLGGQLLGFWAEVILKCAKIREAMAKMREAICAAML